MVLSPKTAAEEMLREHDGYVKQQLKAMKSETRKELESIVFNIRRQSKVIESQPDASSLAGSLDAMNLNDPSA